jgi:hypothetical protein
MAEQDGRSIKRGDYRVVVHEADSRISSRDFADRESAEAYADDAASEAEDGVVLAQVFDDELQLVYAGRHYALKTRSPR